jgi:uncharacterized protein YndB with AHSA1/START domain
MRRRSEIMLNIHQEIVTKANKEKVLKALSTAEGIRGWWTDDCDVDNSKTAYRFDKEKGTMEVGFDVKSTSSDAYVLSCSRGNNQDWLGTTLSFKLIDVAGGTKVELLHEGFARPSEVYAMCVNGWAHFMSSLRAYLDEGKGQPFLRKNK